MPTLDAEALEARAGNDAALRVMPSTLPAAQLIKIRNELRATALDWLRSTKHPEVLGFGYGVRWHDGQPTDQPTFQVYTRAEIDLGAEGPAALFPPMFRAIVTQKVVRGPGDPTVPVQDKLAIDTMEPVQLFAGAPEVARLRARQASLGGGCSIGHPDVTAGTLGFPAVRVDRGGGAPKRTLFVTNCHVLAADPRAPVVGAPVMQPGSVDGGEVDRDVRARVVRCVALRTGMALPNFLDAGLAELTDGTELSEALLGFGDVGHWRAEDDLPIGTLVAKLGRTTGLTFGVVRALGVTYKVRYEDLDLLFADQILTSHLAEGGDSGSALVALGPRPAVVGLVIGGSRDVTLASPIERVHRELGVLCAPERWKAPAPAAASVTKAPSADAIALTPQPATSDALSAVEKETEVMADVQSTPQVDSMEVPAALRPFLHRMAGALVDADKRPFKLNGTRALAVCMALTDDNLVEAASLLHTLAEGVETWNKALDAEPTSSFPFP